MESVTNPKKLKQRKLFLVLPLLVIPFLTMAFWALGGGKGGSDTGANLKTNKGLNLDLPSANIKDDKNADKMSFYEKARLDEEKNLEAMKNDPYFRLAGEDSDSNQLESMVFNSPTTFKSGEPYTGLNTSPVHPENYSDPNETRIMKKLSLLQNEISKPQKKMDEMYERLYVPGNSNREPTGDIDRLAEMASMMKEKTEDDPEMERLEGMLDKIRDIQHPELVKERIKEKSIQHKKQVFPVSRMSNNQNISLFGNTDTGGKDNKTGFYGLVDKKSEAEQNAIEAVIHESQMLVSGSVVKLRLLTEVYVNGTLIPKDNFLFGIASLNGERLAIEINSIRYNQSLFPVKLKVHDLDGLEGIYIPGAITRDVAKQSVDNGLQTIELSTLDPSLAAQATATGINAAKSLLGRKAKLVKVTVKSGYKVLLKDSDSEQ